MKSWTQRAIHSQIIVLLIAACSQQAMAGKEKSADSDNECVVITPTRALRPGTSKVRYTVKNIDPETLVESISEANGSSLVVTQDGCADGPNIQLEFSANEKDFPKTHQLQLTWIRDRLMEFDCANVRCNLISKGLGRIASQLTARKEESANQIATGRLAVCNDGALPDADGECDWKRGGMTSLQVNKPKEDKVKMTVQHSEFL